MEPRLDEPSSPPTTYRYPPFVTTPEGEQDVFVIHYAPDRNEVGKRYF